MKEDVYFQKNKIAYFLVMLAPTHSIFPGVMLGKYVSKFLEMVKTLFEFQLIFFLYFMSNFSVHATLNMPSNKMFSVYFLVGYFHWSLLDIHNFEKSHVNLSICFCCVMKSYVSILAVLYKICCDFLNYKIQVVDLMWTCFYFHIIK